MLIKDRRLSMKEKTIRILSTEDTVLELTFELLEGFKQFYIIDKTKINDFSIKDLLLKLPSYCEYKNGQYDLIIILGYRLDVPERDYNLLFKMEAILENKYKTKVVFITKGYDNYRARLSRFSKISLMPIHVLRDPISFRDNLLQLFGLVSVEDSNRVRINHIPDITSSDDYKIYDKDLPKKADILLSEISASHLFSDADGFSKMSVPYDEDNTINYETEADKILDNAHGDLESMDTFHSFLQNNRRVTYLLLGHRGCGKSSFIHHYFKEYNKFRELNKPFVIIDFLNYGNAIDNKNLNYSIMSALYKYYTSKYEYYMSNEVASLMLRYPSIRSLFINGAVYDVISCFKNNSIDFNEVINDGLQ